MRKTIKLLFLELLGVIFGLTWAGAAIASVYFLYGAMVKDVPWSYLLWSIGIGFIAVQISAAVNSGIQRVDYVNHLIERGYAQAEAEEAWRTTICGGMNLLRNLQQAELSAQIELIETAINISRVHGNMAESLESDMDNLNHKISSQPGYVLVERAEDYEVILHEQPRQLREMSAFCKTAGCRKVLILGPNTKVRLSGLEVFELGKEIAKTDLQIAVVESHDAPDVDVNFLETVALNRGGLIRFFDTDTEAKSWLGV